MFEGFQNFIPQISNRLNLTQSLEASQICTVARQIIQSDYPELAEHLNVASFNKKQLKIHVNSPVIANELHYKKQALLSQINQKLGKKLVENILISSLN